MLYVVVIIFNVFLLKGFYRLRLFFFKVRVDGKFMLSIILNLYIFDMFFFLICNSCGIFF